VPRRTGWDPGWTVKLEKVGKGDIDLGDETLD